MGLYSNNKKKQGIFNNIMENWLRKRVPESFEHTLSNRNIFILPTKFGFAFIFLDVLLFLLGTNYQNNTILLLSYLFASLFLTVMMHCFFNFSGLKFSSSALNNNFANRKTIVPINILTSRKHYDINCNFYSNVDTTSIKNPEIICVEQTEIGHNQILVPYPSLKRGKHKLGRIKVFSEYPLGLFISWSMLDFSHQITVYPSPIQIKEHQSNLSKLNDDKKSYLNRIEKSAGNDDFFELKNYVEGESQASIAWKQLARGQGKLSKHYNSNLGSLHCLKLSEMPSSFIEDKLSNLCFLILELTKKDQEFGLLLDSSNSKIITIKPNSGLQHQQSCLTALAEYKKSQYY